MANNNNPSGYTPPAISDIFTISVSSSARPSFTPPAMAREYCKISEKCQREVTPNAPKWLYCKNYEFGAGAYFACVCKRTNSLSRNQYFSAHCVLQECNGADARNFFISKYQFACYQRGQALVDISDEWAPYDQSPRSTPPTPTSTPAQSTTDTSSQPSTSTQQSTLTQATSALSSTIASGTSTSQSITTTSNTTSSDMPTKTGPADGQIPICGISQKCMTKKPQGEASCNTDDLDCICKASNSLEKNTEFDQQCVLDACYGDIGREEFLDSLFYHCKKVDKELVDIPKRWEPYLPVTFPSATPAPPVESNDTAPAPPPSKLSGGAIGGIVAAAVLVLAIVLGLVKLYWDTRKKAKDLRVKNAKLQDATNPEGVSMRINTLISDSSIPEFASRRDTTSAGRDADPSMYGGASTYNDATLIGSPRSTTVYPVLGNSAATREYKEYGANTEDYAMSEYDDKYTGHGRQYSRSHSQYELSDNERRDGQTAPGQRDSDDDSVSRYSFRRKSYGDDTVDVQQRREAESEWGMAQQREWEQEREQDHIRRSAR